MTDDSELFEPRGFEAYVPALAPLRRNLWGYLAQETRVILELADYLGLERTVRLDSSGLDALVGRIPQRLWDRAQVHLRAHPPSIDEVIATIAAGFDQSRLPSKESPA
jgi:hypothetical protein